MKSTTINGAVLLQAREDRGLSQEQVARLAGVTQSAVSKYENGRLQPSGSTYKAICKALGIHRDAAKIPQPISTDQDAA